MLTYYKSYILDNDIDEMLLPLTSAAEFFWNEVSILKSCKQQYFQVFSFNLRKMPETVLRALF